jgi:hypothetical protein
MNVPLSAVDHWIPMVGKLQEYIQGNKENKSAPHTSDFAH